MNLKRRICNKFMTEINNLRSNNGGEFFVKFEVGQLKLCI